MRVGVINYGVGNLGSVLRSLEELSAEPILIDKAAEIGKTDCLILPGVGNFADCVALLNQGGWVDALQKEVLERRKPLLGICVGMQLLANGSFEGSVNDKLVAGLGFIPGEVKHLRQLGCNLRVPHVGWNSVTQHGESCQLLAHIPDGTDFYFVHSYAFIPNEVADLQATTDYGVPVTAIVRRGHIWGTQFHPEKSSRAGFQLLRNFIESAEC